MVEQPAKAQPTMAAPNYVKQGTYQGITPMNPISYTPTTNTARDILAGEQQKQGQGAYSPFGQVEQMQRKPVQNERLPMTAVKFYSVEILRRIIKRTYCLIPMQG